MYGCVCGPAINGPPIAWFVIVIEAPLPSAVFAVSTLGPLARLVTSPSNLPFARTANNEVTSRPSTPSLMLDA
jgi:hypothetical protein